MATTPSVPASAHTSSEAIQHRGPARRARLAAIWQLVLLVIVIASVFWPWFVSDLGQIEVADPTNPGLSVVIDSQPVTITGYSVVNQPAAATTTGVSATAPQGGLLGLPRSATWLVATCAITIVTTIVRSLLLALVGFGTWTMAWMQLSMLQSRVQAPGFGGEHIEALPALAVHTHSAALMLMTHLACAALVAAPKVKGWLDAAERIGNSPTPPGGALIALLNRKQHSSARPGLMESPPPAPPG